MTDEELIKRLREGATWDDDIAAADRIEALVKERDAAYAYAKHLAEAIFANSQFDAPQWEPLEDTLGVLMQIDNMVAGIRARAERLEVALREVADEASVPVHTWKNGINFKKMYEGWRKIATDRIDIARAALKGDDHE